MIILCDTSSILLLLQIAPDMLTNHLYGCATIPAIRDEVFKTQKFKEKYPWRIEYKGKLKTLTYSQYNNDEYKFYLKSIEFLLNAGVINNVTGKLINLSPEDCEIISCALANGHQLSSGDVNLVVLQNKSLL